MSDHTTTESVTFSETRTVNGKKLAVYFSRNEGDAFRFARENNGYSYLFIAPDMYRILVPIKAVIDEVKV